MAPPSSPPWAFFSSVWTMLAYCFVARALQERAQQYNEANIIQTLHVIHFHQYRAISKLFVLGLYAFSFCSTKLTLLSLLNETRADQIVSQLGEFASHLVPFYLCAILLKQQDLDILIIIKVSSFTVIKKHCLNSNVFPFNLIMEIHFMINWQLSKLGTRWPVWNDCVGCTVYNLLRWWVF